MQMQAKTACRSGHEAWVLSEGGAWSRASALPDGDEGG